MPLITRAIIDARFAPRIGRQMRLDLRKLRFRQPKLVATHLCLLFGSRESRHYVRANTFMGPDPSSASPSTATGSATGSEKMSGTDTNSTSGSQKSSGNLGAPNAAGGSPT